MKWLLLLFVGWITIFPDPGIAAPPDIPDPLPSPTLFRQSSASTTHLILGRLQLDPVRYRKGSQSLVHVATSPDATPLANASLEPLTETLHVSSTRGLPTVHYSVIGPSSRIMIDADAKGIWRIESQRNSIRGNGKNASVETTRVIVEQKPNQSLAMKIQSDAPDRMIRAATWLHLREAERDVFEVHLEPILDELLWPYRLSDLADAAHSQSLRDSPTSLDDADVVQNAELQVWIDDLRSPVRAARVNAERRLCSIGVSLIPRLANLDLNRLDAEQRARLIKIQNQLTPLAEDDASRLSLLIRDDRDYWQLASTRLNKRDRQLVDARIKKLSAELPPAVQDNSIVVAVDERPTRR